MLTGERMISDGEMFTNGYNQKSQLSHIYKIIGYCPQFDALLNDLTCRETLEIFSMIRGIPIRDTKYFTEYCARNLDFIQHIDKKVIQLRWAFFDFAKKNNNFFRKSSIWLVEAINGNLALVWQLLEIWTLSFWMNQQQVVFSYWFFSVPRIENIRQFELNFKINLWNDRFGSSYKAKSMEYCQSIA